MKIPVEILLELARIHADVAALANETAKMEFEIYKRIRFEEEDEDYGSECERCDSKTD